MEDTFDKLKHKAKEVAEKVTDKDIYTGDDDENKNNDKRYATEREHRSKEPMNPEDIGKHEPTAVKRDKNQPSGGDPV
jgi:actin-related protein